ncbi:MAG TPA: FtsQ-type POTRA domain-containing protein, partial [Burkholderiaceae bacterium]|nr:FtsQ-type POTRA domain-containing protein [Burkholderiaceae bacterium]
RWLAALPLLDIRRVEVRGDLMHVRSASVRAAVAGKIAGNFLTVRLDDVRQAFESIPWVAAASVRRAWPDRLVVTLSEHRALGLWSDGQLLSDRGRLFVANAAEAEIYGPLVQFDGPPQFAAEAARRYYEFAAALAPLALTLAGLEISERGSWCAITDIGQRFELGRDDPPGRLSAALARLVAVYPTVTAQLGGPPRRIDMRYPNGLAAAPGKNANPAARKS